MGFGDYKDEGYKLDIETILLSIFQFINFHKQLCGGNIKDIPLKFNSVSKAISFFISFMFLLI